MRVRHLLLAAALLLVAAPPAAAATKWKKQCHGTPFDCTTVKVPLDRSGAVPGEIPLYVERFPGGGRKPLFALAGGPGQGNTSNTEGFNQGLAYAQRGGRYLVVPDQRGTGRSNAILCPSLETPDDRPLDVRTADCADRLGARRSLYTTRDSVEDLEAVRVAIGADKISLFGVSYGTKVATAYALKYPERVDRLVLDSVVEPEGQSPFDLDTFAALPRAMREVCRGECPWTGDFGGDVSTLASQLADAPLRGPFVGRGGKRRTVSLTARGLYVLLRSGDLDGEVRAEYPGAIHSALAGDPAPLLRMEHRFDALRADPPRRGPKPEEAVRSLSQGLFAATICEEAPLPWERTATRDERIQQARDRAFSLPDSVFEPFGREMALTLDGESLLFQCSRWPAAASAPVLAGLDRPFPDIPVLVLEGREDLRTPLEVGQRLAGRFARADVVQVPKAAHAVVGAPCLNDVFKRWFAGRAIGSPCASRKRDQPVRAPLPASLSAVRGSSGAARTAAAAALTVEDAARELSRLFGSRNLRSGGLRGGVFTKSGGKLRFKRVVLVPGVTVSGTIGRRTGALRLTGKSATHGNLKLRRGVLSGRLGGKRVHARVDLAQL